MDRTLHESLAGAIGIGPHEVVAFVGGGGKTSALRLLAEELALRGDRVLATTTTAMLMREMQAVGPVFREADGDLAEELKAVLSEVRVAAVARADGEGGKMSGLSRASVDGLYALGLTEHVVVEADGSRGLPFKAFGPHEPQLPAATTTVVDVAGLDVLGSPLDEGHVHRAGLLAAALGIPLGSDMTPRVLANGLRVQVARLRRSCAGCRTVVMLNKADGPPSRAAGLEVASALLAHPETATEPGGEGDRVADECDARPDAVIVGSLHRMSFTVLRTGE